MEHLFYWNTVTEIIPLTRPNSNSPKSIQLLCVNVPRQIPFTRPTQVLTAISGILCSPYTGLTQQIIGDKCADWANPTHTTSILLKQPFTDERLSWQMEWNMSDVMLIT